MKKCLIGLVVLLNICFVSVSNASCYYKVIVGKKVKVCNPGDNPGKALKMNIEGLVDIWHEAYGVLPSDLREVLNDHFLGLVVAMYGDLPDAMVAEYVSYLFQGIWERHKDNQNLDLPKWKQDKLQDLEIGESLVEPGLLKNRGEPGVEALRDYYEAQRNCILDSKSPSEAGICYDDFMNNFYREATK